MRSRGQSVVFLDGEDVRAIMDNDLGHSLEDRRTNAWRICRLCQHLDRQGIDVVCATLSNQLDTQDWNRENYTSYLEVLIDVPMDVLVARDQKGLYSGAMAGEVVDVVGLDIPFDPPPNADLVVNNSDPATTPGALADEILAAADNILP